MREYLLVMLSAAAATYLLAGLARFAAIKLGIQAQPRARDVHTKPTPYLGGLAMLVGVGVAFILAAIMPFLGRHEVVARDSLGIFLAAAVICAVGALDDAIDLPAIAKAAGQVLAAGIAVLNGVRLYWISLPDSIIAIDNVTSILITVVFIFVSVNAINFADGLDGLAAGIVAIGAFAMFSYTYVLAREENFVVATTASLVAITTTGICLGFLPHNFHKAKMFMGDSGSMLLGLLLACSSLSLTGQIDARSLNGAQGGLLATWLPLILPFAIMALPLFDFCSAYVRRTMRGQWWFVADKQHLHHRLLDRGLSVRRAVMVLYLWTAVIAFGVVLVGLLRSWWAFAGWLLVTVLAVLTTGKSNAKRGTESHQSGEISA